MRTFLGILIGAFVTIAAFAATLPSTTSLTRWATMDAEPQDVYAILADLGRLEEWYAGPIENAVVTGPPGVGQRVSYTLDPGGEVVERIVAVSPNELVRGQMVLAAGDVEWVFSLTPTERGTFVQWSAQIDFGNNPLAKLRGAIIRRALPAEFERSLENLEAAVR